MNTWIRSRAAQKFFTNRLAIGALAVVLLYVAIAIATGVFGVITKDTTFRRVGPKQMPGFFRAQSLEKRLSDAEYVLSQVESATRRADPAAALNDLDLGQRRVKSDDIPGLKAQIESAWKIYDQLAEVEDLTQEPEAAQQVGQMESIVNALFHPLSPTESRARWFELVLGTDAQGRSIALRALYSIEVAIKIGTVVAFLSVLFGAVLGTAAGYYGGWVDHIVTWLFTTFSSIPSLVLLVLLAYLFTGSSFEGTLVPMYIAFSVTYWIGPCRVIRGETMKLKELEYVQAAVALGFGRPYIMLRHILPNAVHLMLINFSLMFIAAIKGEVILTYLGLGIKNGTSWGIMIEQSRPEVINGFFWQIGTATFLMFGLVLAFNILSDALQDAFDPKHVS